jgi:integrase
MARNGPHHRLSATFVRTCKTPGVYQDGGGLRFRVMANGSRVWIMRVTHEGQRVDIGLGPLATLSLAHARQKAGAIRQTAADGGNPVGERQTRRRERRAEQPIPPPIVLRPSFKACWTAYWALKEPQLSNSKHRDQWVSTMKAYVLPFIGDRPVADITPADIINMLAPIWHTKEETARRVLQRVDAIFVSAMTRELRDRANPCTGVSRELGHRRHDPVHHAALPYQDVGNFVYKMHQRKAPLASRLAFEFLILTATRSGETRGALWSEINITDRLWTIPAARMKARSEHSIPLSGRALEILQAVRAAHTDSLLCFPNARGKPFSDMVFTKTLRDMKLSATATAHGFRTSFKIWAAETGIRDEVSEAALAHADTNQVRAAYRRTTYLDERRMVMDEWAKTVCMQNPQSR